MIEWYEKVINLILTTVAEMQQDPSAGGIAGGVDSFSVQKAVAEKLDAVEVRRGALELIDCLYERGIDFVIISAGWADVIEELLSQWGVDRK